MGGVRTACRTWPSGSASTYCLGASLARVESQIAFTNLVQRLDDPELTMAPADLPWQPTVLSRGVRSLPITCTPGRSTLDSPVRDG